MHLADAVQIATASGHIPPSERQRQSRSSIALQASSESAVIAPAPVNNHTIIPSAQQL